jgi:hypothetical protein
MLLPGTRASVQADQDWHEVLALPGRQTAVPWRYPPSRTTVRRSVGGAH